ncbi:MAG: hypothetical protein KF768_13570 [Phycisphaeraceae bacterium]|nr:hypothetical protein [Phycisphaeraceae bacterium]
MARSKSKQEMGGKARAAALTPEEKKAIARKGAEARWGVDMPVASHEGEFLLGDKTISAAVLPNGKRLLTQATFLRALGRSRSPKAGTGVLSTVDGLPFFLQAHALKPFISEDLSASTTPIFFRNKDNKRMVGYDAHVLPDVAEVYLKYRDSLVVEGKDTPPQYAPIFAACDAIMRGLARIGIVALVDEATGYQYDRPRRELEEQLAKFVSESLRRWVATFPADYFKQLCRLRGVDFNPATMKLPQYFGHLTNDLIYRRLAPGLVRKLKERRLERGRSSNRLWQWLSDDVGYPGVLMHLGTVVGLMKIHNDYDSFKAQLDLIAPVWPETPGLFDKSEDWR